MAATVDAVTATALQNLFLRPSKEGLLALEWSAFEDFVQYVFECAGYHVTKVAPYHQKHHVDLELRHKSEGRVIAHVEVRRYSTANIIKARVLQFLGALNHKRIQQGFLITTSDFTQPAYEVAESSGGKVRLMNSEKFVVRPESWTGRLIKYDRSKRRAAACVNVVSSVPSSKRGWCSKSSAGRNERPRCAGSTN